MELMLTSQRHGVPRSVSRAEQIPVPDELTLGSGLGAILAKSRTISSSMIMASANALSELSPALKDPGASLLPDLADVRDVSVYVAAAVVRQAVAEGNAQDEYTIKVVKGEADQTLEDFIIVCPP